MPGTDQEIYDHFRGMDRERPEIIALAFAVFASSKYDWSEHVRRQRGSPPSADEATRWVQELSQTRLDEIWQAAIGFFDLAARAYMAADLEKAIETARDDAIVREIRASNEAVAARVTRATAFGSTFLPNLFIGVVASVAFSVLVIGASLIFARDPSPFALYRSLQPATAPP